MNILTNITSWTTKTCITFTLFGSNTFSIHTNSANRNTTISSFIFSISVCSQLKQKKNLRKYWIIIDMRQKCSIYVIQYKPQHSRLISLLVIVWVLVTVRNFILNVEHRGGKPRHQLLTRSWYACFSVTTTSTGYLNKVKYFSVVYFLLILCLLLGSDNFIFFSKLLIFTHSTMRLHTCGPLSLSSISAVSLETSFQLINNSINTKFNKNAFILLNISNEILIYIERLRKKIS